MNTYIHIDIHTHLYVHVYAYVYVYIYIYAYQWVNYHGESDKIPWTERSSFQTHLKYILYSNTFPVFSSLFSCRL